MGEGDDSWDEDFVKREFLNQKEPPESEKHGYTTYSKKKGKDGKITRTEEETTWKQIVEYTQHISTAIEKLVKENKPLTFNNILNRVKQKGMRRCDVSSMYSTLEFDFAVEWAETNEKMWSKVIKEEAYKPLLEMLKTYKDTKDLNDYTNSVDAYITNAASRVEWGFHVENGISSNKSSIHTDIHPENNY